MESSKTVSQIGPWEIICTTAENGRQRFSAISHKHALHLSAPSKKKLLEYIIHEEQSEFSKMNCKLKATQETLTDLFNCWNNIQGEQNGEGN